jgi:hypothetical protein
MKMLLSSLVALLVLVACSTTKEVVTRNVAAPGQPEKFAQYDRVETKFCGLPMYATMNPYKKPMNAIERTVAQYRPAVVIAGWASLILGLSGVVVAIVCASNGVFARWSAWGVRCAVAGLATWMICLSLTTMLELWKWLVLGVLAAVTILIIYEFRHHGFGRKKEVAK